MISVCWERTDQVSEDSVTEKLNIHLAPPTQVNQLFALWPHPSVWIVGCAKYLTQDNCVS